MELEPAQFKEWILLFSGFTWPIVLVIVLIIYKDAVVHLLKMLIDLLAKLLKLR